MWSPAWAEFYGIQPWHMSRLAWREVELVLEDLEAKRRQAQQSRKRG